MKHFKLISATLMATCFAFILNSCGNSSRNSDTVSQDGTFTTDMSDYDNSQSEQVSAAIQFIRANYPGELSFVGNKQIVRETSVKNRYVVSGAFLIKSSWDKVEGRTFKIYVQKFSDGWEFGQLMIATEGEPSLSNNLKIYNGRMKEREKTDGVGYVIYAGGIKFTIAEIKGTNVRIYSDKKLTKGQLLVAIKDLRKDYDGIQFNTAQKHERGDEYAYVMGKYLVLTSEPDKLITIDE